MVRGGRASPVHLPKELGRIPGGDPSHLFPGSSLGAHLCNWTHLSGNPGLPLPLCPHFHPRKEPSPQTRCGQRSNPTQDMGGREEESDVGGRERGRGQPRQSLAEPEAPFLCWMNESVSETMWVLGQTPFLFMGRAVVRAVRGPGLAFPFCVTNTHSKAPTCLIK